MGIFGYIFLILAFSTLTAATFLLLRSKNARQKVKLADKEKLDSTIKTSPVKVLVTPVLDCQDDLPSSIRVEPEESECHVTKPSRSIGDMVAAIAESFEHGQPIKTFTVVKNPDKEFSATCPDPTAPGERKLHPTDRNGRPFRWKRRRMISR